MTIERILSANDPRVAMYRGVADPELVRSHGLFIAEGRLIVRRVIESGRFHVRSVLCNEAARRDLDDVLTRLPPSVAILVCDVADFEQVTGYNIHRGCLALVERPPMPSVNDLVAAASCVVVLEGVGDADNVGSIFRNAAAFGVDAIVLSPTTCDPLYRKAIRTSMGAALQVPFARADQWPGAIDQLRGAGFTIAALTPRHPSIPLDEYARGPRPEKLALVVGTEGGGLSHAIESRADVRVRIPIGDAVDSLNVATAVAIALWGIRDP